MSKRVITVWIEGKSLTGSPTTLVFDPEGEGYNEWCPLCEQPRERK